MHCEKQFDAYFDFDEYMKHRISVLLFSVYWLAGHVATQIGELPAAIENFCKVRDVTCLGIWCGKGMVCGRGTTHCSKMPTINIAKDDKHRTAF